MTTTPALNGQIIGMTHYATRALLDRVLRSVDMTFEQSVVLNLAASADSPIAREQIVSRVTSGLKVGDDVAITALDGLVVAGLVSAGDEVAVTDQGADRQRLIRGEIDTITASLRRSARRRSGDGRPRAHDGDGASQRDARRLTIATVAAVTTAAYDADAMVADLGRLVNVESPSHDVAAITASAHCPRRSDRRTARISARARHRRRRSARALARRRHASRARRRPSRHGVPTRHAGGAAVHGRRREDLRAGRVRHEGRDRHRHPRRRVARRPRRGRAAVHVRRGGRLADVSRR